MLQASTKSMVDRKPPATAELGGDKSGQVRQRRNQENREKRSEFLGFSPSETP